MDNAYTESLTADVRSVRMDREVERDAERLQWARLYPTVCLDFDGTLNQYKGWTGKFEMPEPLPGLRDFLVKLRERGYNLIVLTARPTDALDEVRDWLRANGVDELIAMVTNRKPPAVVYLDDRGVRFRGDFEIALFDIERGKRPWWDITGDADAPTPDQRAQLDAEASPDVKPL